MIDNIDVLFPESKKLDATQAMADMIAKLVKEISEPPEYEIKPRTMRDILKKYEAIGLPPHPGHTHDVRYPKHQVLKTYYGATLEELDEQAGPNWEWSPDE